MHGVYLSTAIRSVCLVVLLSGCATSPAPVTRSGAAAPAFSHRVHSPHVALSWNCLQGEPGVLHLDGLAANPWSMQPVKFLEFEVVGVDARGRAVSAARSEAPAIQLFTNQATPFQLAIRPAGTEVRFDLYYEYRFQDSSRSWTVSADPRVPIQLAQQLQRFLVLDACSPSQHRAP